MFQAFGNLFILICLLKPISQFFNQININFEIEMNMRARENKAKKMFISTTFRMQTCQFSGFLIFFPLPLWNFQKFLQILAKNYIFFLFCKTLRVLTAMSFPVCTLQNEDQIKLEMIAHGENHSALDGRWFFYYKMGFSVKNSARLTTRYAIRHLLCTAIIMLIQHEPKN